MIFNLLLFQIITIGYYKGNFGSKVDNLDIYLKTGFAFVLFELILCCYFKIMSYRERRIKYSTYVRQLKSNDGIV